MTNASVSAEGVAVLIVDDEPENAGLAERALRSFDGLVIIAALSGERALAILETRPVDIMLVDQAMPGMTGVEFVERARVLAPEAVFIMVTGYPELDQVLRAQQVGLIHHLIAKPWRLDDIQGAVRRALIGRDLRSTVAKLEAGGGRGRDPDDGGPE